MHIPRGSGQVRFRRVPVQMPIGEVPEGSSADAEVRFRKVAVQIPRSGPGRFRYRGYLRFQMVPVQIPR